MANDTRNYPDFVFIAYDEDFSAQTHDVAVSLEAGSLVGVPVKYVRHELNTRPAAPVEGLETVGHMGKTRMGWVPSFHGAGEPVVTRSQAEAIIAAKDERIEELEEKEAHWCNENRRNLRNGQYAAYKLEALETQLAAARKFIQFCADGFFVTDDELQGAAEAALEAKP